MQFEKFRLRVPATSANIGAGFDCTGLALKLYNYLEFSSSDTLEIVTDGGLPKDATNLVVRTVKKTFDLFKREMPAFRLVQTNNIPCASGLGSSASCIAGGVFAASKMLGGAMSKSEIINFCTALEGHPDNVVPALTGGISAGVITDSEEVVVKTVFPKTPYMVACFTPEFELHTEHARKILPKDYLRSDLVYNCSRAILTFLALEEGNLSQLDKVMGDRIHEPYRLPLIKNSADIIKTMQDKGIMGVYLSGAGPTIAGFVPLGFDNIPNIKNGTFRLLEVDTEGLTQI